MYAKLAAQTRLPEGVAAMDGGSPLVKRHLDPILAGQEEGMTWVPCEWITGERLKHFSAWCEATRKTPSSSAHPSRRTP